MSWSELSHWRKKEDLFLSKPALNWATGEWGSVPQVDYSRGVVLLRKLCIRAPFLLQFYNTVSPACLIATSASSLDYWQGFTCHVLKPRCYHRMICIIITLRDFLKRLEGRCQASSSTRAQEHFCDFQQLVSRRILPPRGMRQGEASASGGSNHQNNSSWCRSLFSLLVPDVDLHSPLLPWQGTPLCGLPQVSNVEAEHSHRG